jgi:hypothetical protein
VRNKKVSKFENSEPFFTMKNLQKVYGFTESKVTPVNFECNLGALRSSHFISALVGFKEPQNQVGKIKSKIIHHFLNIYELRNVYFKKRLLFAFKCPFIKEINHELNRFPIKYSKKHKKGTFSCTQKTECFNKLISAKVTIFQSAKNHG